MGDFKRTRAFCKAENKTNTMLKVATLLIVLMASQLPVVRPDPGDLQQCFGSKASCENWPCDQNCKDLGYNKGRCPEKKFCPTENPWACMCKPGQVLQPVPAPTPVPAPVQAQSKKL